MSKKIILYGKHSVQNILQNPLRKIEKILCTNSSLKYLKNETKNVSVVDRMTIEKTLASNGIQNALHQDLVVFTSSLIQPNFHEILKSSNLLVLLNELQDSQNIGAIIRSAALFNANAVISTIHNSPQENSHIIKASCGAFEHIPFISVNNLSAAIKTLKENNYWVIGMSCDATDSLQSTAQKFSKGEKIAIVVGNEENGMKKMIEKSCDFLVKIPINTSRGVDSLNAASAAAIFLYELSTRINNLNA